MRRLIAAGLFVIATLSGAATSYSQGFMTHGWMTDFNVSSVEMDEIVSGGPPRDGIPSIDDPRFVSATSEQTVQPKEPVIRLEINGDVRAYPLRIMTWHEIVNDTVGGVPVAVTYCPLCNSAIAFQRQLDGESVEFGTTGLLRKSDMIMYDRKTESWWQQFTGEAIVGKKTGDRLTMLPVTVESFELFRTAYPNGKVLVPNHDGLRRYGENPYVNYDSRDRPYPLFMGNLPSDVDPMTRVVVIKDTKAGQPRAVTLPRLREDGRLRLGDVELRWIAGQNSALDTEAIADGKDVGNVTALRHSGNRQSAVVYDVTFAFAYRAFHPDGELLK
ncbi:DUF3179 domain-containing protein [Coralliovum pocilloporae]|uniref:DUF3179 domain-containing protein n=1 Tax=Coralliovum pocilloporae TaxID=3066369 RepID=UPI00330707E7